MHFQVQMRVRLAKPLEMADADQDERPIVGYVITMKVHATDAVDAVRLAQQMALAPPDRDGKPRSFVGLVEEVNGFEIEAPAAEPARPGLVAADQQGVYHKTGLMFFHEGDEDEDEPE